MINHLIQGFCPVCNQSVTNSDVVDWQGIELVFKCPKCGKGGLYVEDLRKEPGRNRGGSLSALMGAALRWFDDSAANHPSRWIGLIAVIDALVLWYLVTFT